MDFWTEIPSLGKRDLRDLKKSIDGSFKSFSRTLVQIKSNNPDFENKRFLSFTSF